MKWYEEIPDVLAFPISTFFLSVSLGTSLMLLYLFLLNFVFT